MIACVWIIVVLAQIVGSIVVPIHGTCVPQEGVWYCKELNLTLSFERETSSTYFVDGNIVLCQYENERWTNDIYVTCKKSNNSTFEVGDKVFSGTCVELSDQVLIIREDISREKYVFIRTD